jgi:rare lipoprotein A (peptidoglycan hydrolase)
MIPRKEAGMLLSKKLPRSLQTKARLSRLVLLSLLVQSCGTLSLSQQNEDHPEALAEEPSTRAITPKEASLKEVSLEKTRARRTTAEHAMRGIASWYGPGFHGRKTASGDIYNQNEMTAAHKTLPLGSEVRVTNLNNGNTVDVEINDRGPYIEGRIIDLSRAAAGALDFVESGTIRVSIEVIADPTGTLLAEDEQVASYR